MITKLQCLKSRSRDIPGSNDPVEHEQCHLKHLSKHFKLFIFLTLHTHTPYYSGPNLHVNKYFF